MMLGLAGWALYRRWIVLDGKKRTIRIRCGIGPFSWTRERSFDEFRQIVVYRRPSRNDHHVCYRIVAQGNGQSLTIGTSDGPYLERKDSMSIIPASRLSSSDRRLLGNNLDRPKKCRPGLSHRRQQKLIVSAVNRSLAVVGEQIGVLHPSLVLA